MTRRILARGSVGIDTKWIALAEKAIGVLAAIHRAGVGGHLCLFAKFFDGEFAFGKGIGIGFFDSDGHGTSHGRGACQFAALSIPKPDRRVSAVGSSRA